MVVEWMRVNPVRSKEISHRRLCDAGVNVVDIGGVTTDMLYYAVGSSEEYSGGIVVSASHNPRNTTARKWSGKKLRPSLPTPDFSNPRPDQSRKRQRGLV
jgi:hypothetical protein